LLENQLRQRLVLLLTPVRPAVDREVAPSPEDRFTFLTQQRSVSLHARRNPLNVWNVLAAQPHRVVVAQSLLFLGVGITQCRQRHGTDRGQNDDQLKALER
jgi:hypothetical protein